MWHVHVWVGRDSKHVEIKFYGEISLLMLWVMDHGNWSARVYKPRKLSDQISPLLTSMPPLCWCGTWCLIAADIYLSCIYLFIMSCSVEGVLLYYGHDGRWMLKKGCLAILFSLLQLHFPFLHPLSFSCSSISTFSLCRFSFYLPFILFADFYSDSCRMSILGAVSISRIP